MAKCPAAHQGRGCPHRNPLSVDDMIGLHNNSPAVFEGKHRFENIYFSHECLMGGNINIETAEPPEIAVLAGRGSLRR